MNVWLRALFHDLCDFSKSCARLRIVTRCLVPAFGGPYFSESGRRRYGTDAEAGPADDPAVILLHGWPYDIHSCVGVAPLLASAGYGVGYGFVVDYIAEVLKHLRTEDFTGAYKKHFELASEVSTRDQTGFEKTFSGPTYRRYFYPTRLCLSVCVDAFASYRSHSRGASVSLFRDSTKESARCYGER